MDNYDNVIRFLRLISHEKGLNISQRNLTVSTCGIVPGILKFAKEGLQVTLALSLHAPMTRCEKLDAGGKQLPSGRYFRCLPYIF